MRRAAMAMRETKNTNGDFLSFLSWKAMCWDVNREVFRTISTRKSIRAWRHMRQHFRDEARTGRKDFLHFFSHRNLKCLLFCCTMSFVQTSTYYESAGLVNDNHVCQRIANGYEKIFRDCFFTFFVGFFFINELLNASQRQTGAIFCPAASSQRFSITPKNETINEGLFPTFSPTNSARIDFKFN